MSINSNNITDIDDSTLLITESHRKLAGSTTPMQQSKQKDFFLRKNLNVI